jgi:hypothetical protein
MFRRSRLARLLALTGGILAAGTATGGLEGSASAAPYKCVFVTDGQGKVIETVCVPWPLT